MPLQRFRVFSVNLVPVPVVTEDVIVTATRSEKRLQDEPLRVEILGRDEIEEKLLMTPGDIAMMLNWSRRGQRDGVWLARD
ncbi:MAG TPA: hypothetical protein VES67_16150 [Vicinamibacterales bacterium]|nr:hypothetical protein [Vicinamibacterales bacterium]